MKIQQTILFIAVALMTTASANAQDCGCEHHPAAASHVGLHHDGGCGGIGADQFPTDSFCKRAWGYNDAIGLWSGYCHQGQRQRGFGFGHGCGCGKAGCLGCAAGKAGGCTDGSCSFKWPESCGHAGFGFNFHSARLGKCGCRSGLVGKGGFGWAKHGGCGCGLSGLLKFNGGGPDLSSYGFDHGYSHGPDCGCGCLGGRHGIDLFSGLKKGACQLGQTLGHGHGSCGSRCGGGFGWGHGFGHGSFGAGHGGCDSPGCGGLAADGGCGCN